MTLKLSYPDGATPLDPNELAGLKHKHIRTQAQLDELEQANIVSGLRWLSRSQRKDVFSENFVMELHRKLFGDVWEWAGVFRRTGKNIGVDAAQIGAQLRGVIDDARYWADHQTYRPVEAALRLHHRIAFVHPFSNGNGRHARIMADVVLERIYGHAPIDWAAGSNLQEMTERRHDYIKALRAADDFDLAPLLAFAGKALDH